MAKCVLGGKACVGRPEGTSVGSIDRACVAHAGLLTDVETVARQSVGWKFPKLSNVLAQIERSAIRRVLTSQDGNVSASARMLGMDRKALERRIVKYRIKVTAGGQVQ